MNISQFRYGILLPLFLSVSISLSWARPAKIQVVCLGESITAGTGVVKAEKNAYPAQLQALLGKLYEIKSYGIERTTVLKNGDNPYWNTRAWGEATKQKADLVFLLFGNQDVKSQNRQFLGEFEKDYHDMVQKVKAMRGKPRVILLLPPPSFQMNKNGMWDPIIRKEIAPAIRRVALAEGVEMIDLHPMFQGRDELFPNLLYPSSLGASLIARRLYEAIQAPTDEEFDVVEALAYKGQPKSFDFHGYEGAELVIHRRATKIVRPRRTAAGRPWVWRARFWGEEPQTDIGLLERGFHIVYTDVADMFGAPAAVEVWDDFYQKIKGAGLSPKPVLEGMSRGGLMVYNWAAQNPEKVGAIYADAPVLDIKSWPGGNGAGKGNAADWQKCLRMYGFGVAKQAMIYRDNPLDKAGIFAEAGIPMLHVCGAADSVVPYAENTGPFAEKIRASGGNIQVILKEGVGHHPHSLTDPSPILDFILEATGQKFNLAKIPQPSAEYRAGAGWAPATDWYQQMTEIDQNLDSLAELDILFLGNSITQGLGGRRLLLTHRPGEEAYQAHFGNQNTLNAGISGDRTEHILWRLQSPAFNQINPKQVVLSIGVNNFPHNSAEQITEGILAIQRVLKIRYPQARLFISGVFPTGLQPLGAQRMKYERVHQLLEEKLSAYQYFPVGRAWILPTGELDMTYLAKDGIHLTPAGYEAWMREIKAYLMQ
ncbi:MAG: GDSL-type esterase/lipase family protein [Bacteroidota bacterium]